jgi:hypothetical protein
MIMNNFNKLFGLMLVLLAIFSTGVALFIYWSWWPYDPITIHSIEILNNGKTVEQGGTLAYRIKWTKRTDKQGKVSRYFVNGHKHPLDDSDDKNPVSAPPGSGEADIFANVPESTPIGRGRMQWCVAYPVNPIRNESYPKPPAYSDEFTVTAKKVKGLKGERGAKGDKGDRGAAGVSKGSGYSVFGDVKVSK